MKDVAHAAGVSYQTVSRVLNDHPHVNEQTRARVLASIQALGYLRNAAGRQLRIGEQPKIGVLAPDSMDYGTMQALLGAEETARHAGYSLLLARFREPGAPDARGPTIPAFAQQALVGAIVLDAPCSVVNELERYKYLWPTMMLCDVKSPYDDGETNGAALSVRHLIDHGHSRIGYLSGPRGWLVSDRRRSMWQHAMCRAGLDPSAVLEGNLSARSGYDIGVELTKSRLLTGVVSANDRMALGLLRGLQESGMRVPHDISVVGFDGQPGSEYFSPPLTTVRQDFAAIGSACVKTLIRHYQKNSPDPGESQPPLLIARGSSGALMSTDY